MPGGRFGRASALLSRLPLPRRLPELLAVRDVVSADPAVAAAALTGLLGDEQVREDEESLASLTMPALVIGHRGDPLHAIADARDLAYRLPKARLMVASSILEFRVRPEPLARAMREFLGQIDW